MDLQSNNLLDDSLILQNPPFREELSVPDIGSTVIIVGSNPSKLSVESPSKICTGKRVLCSFSSNNTDLDEYPCHALTYGEPGELLGLTYNDHNYVKVNDDVTSNDNQLTMLAKVALSKHATMPPVELPHSDLPKLTDSPGSFSNGSTSNEIVSSSGHKESNLSCVTIINTPLIARNSTSISPSFSGSTCKVATSNGRTILLTPSRGNLGASVQIHRVSSVNTPQVVIRTDYNSPADGYILNGTPGSVNNTIRCICGSTRDDSLVQCASCKVFQHAECMAHSSGSTVSKPYLCELCQPRPIMVSKAASLQRRRLAASSMSPGVPTTAIQLANPPTTFRLPSQPPNHSPNIASNRFFLTGSANGQATTTLSVRPIQVRLSDVAGTSASEATLYQVGPTTLKQFSPQFINLESTMSRQSSQPACTTPVCGSQRSSKRKQDLFTLAGESVPAFDNIAEGYAFDENSAASNSHQVLTSHTIEHSNSAQYVNGSDLPGPKFYRTPSQTVIHAGGLDSVEGTKSPSAGAVTTTLPEVPLDVVSSTETFSTCVPEPASPDVVIRSDSYEKAAETRLSDALKQRIRNIFLAPSERELKTLQMADSSALSRGQQRCRVASLEMGRKCLVATECIYPNQPIIEYKGYAMLMDEYSQHHDYRRHYNPFVLFYKQLDKVVICLDASNYGNEARFIRRSCAPNCEVRLTFPPTDSFSSVVNPQCIQFVVTSAINRTIPLGTELTVAFDFDYTACSYPVRCACTREGPLCAVADWFRRYYHIPHSHPRIYDDTLGDGNSGNSYDGDFGVDEDVNHQHSRSVMNSLPPGYSEKSSKSRIGLKRLITNKRVSPAFSRVPYPSAKHMVQEKNNRRRHSGLRGADVVPVKRGGRGSRGGRGGVRGRGAKAFFDQNYRVSRPRGRPPISAIKRHLSHRSSSPHSAEGEEEEENRLYSSSPAFWSSSSSPRTDITEPGASSPWFYPGHPSKTASRRRENDVRIDRKHLRKKRFIKRQASNIQSPHRTRKSSLDNDIPPEASKISSHEVDKTLTATICTNSRTEESNLRITTSSKVKQTRKRKRRLSNSVDVLNRDTVNPLGKNEISQMKRPYFQSENEANPPTEKDAKKVAASRVPVEQLPLSTVTKSREDIWMAEVLRRIERMEKKRKKRSKTPSLKKSENVSISPDHPHPPPDFEVGQSYPDVVNGDHSEQQPTKEEPTVVLKKQRRRSVPSDPNEATPLVAPLSREDRWMQWQIQRIAEMESSDTLNDNQQPCTNVLPVKSRRRSSSGAKSALAIHASSKKDEIVLSSVEVTGKEQCCLIVYKHRDPDPMAKFSRSRTGHHHRQQQQQRHSPVTRTFSLVENVVDEDLPAGGELLDDQTANGSTPMDFSDSVCATSSVNVGSSHPRPSKKRWLSQALMEEDQQQQQQQQNNLGRTTPSPENSSTPTDYSNNQLHSHVQRALNPKKRIISQLEEEMAMQHLAPSGCHVNTASPASTLKLPLKKRQAEEDESANDTLVETVNKPKQEKVRVSLSEYRRRRGLSTASIEPIAANKLTTLPSETKLVTPPGSPVVDLKRLVTHVAPPLPTEGLAVGGPRTPSEPPSEDEVDRLKGLPPRPFSSLSPSQQLPPSLQSLGKDATDELLEKAYNAKAAQELQTKPPCRPSQLDRYRRQFSGHAQRRASPPPPPLANSTVLLSCSPQASWPDLKTSQGKVKQLSHKHHNQQLPWRSQQNSHTSSSTPVGHNLSALTLSPPIPISSRSHHFPFLSQPLTPTSTSAFNHHNMESIQETLKQKQKHLQAQLHDLQKATASGSG